MLKLKLPHQKPRQPGLVVGLLFAIGLAFASQNLQAQNLQATEETSVEQRLQAERDYAFEPFVILPHRPSYLIFGHYLSQMNNAPYQHERITEHGELNNNEMKFQISMKLAVADDFLGGRWFMAYTNRSFWQAFNNQNSAPFRETNHEPEAWVSYDLSQNIAGWNLRLFSLGISHQSNGQTEPVSRSWNRIYARFLFEKGNQAIVLKPWWRIKENPKFDDNPDIEDYMGRFELGYVHKFKQSNLSLLLRNNLKSKENHGAMELGYSFKVRPNVNAYLQWFNGYGESMIDYNYHHNSIGIGIQLGGWL